ncbi:hypothetical protein KY358_05970 [Candidatus Woesearchaeota archaeon]|nr:hypothetical protein [Candidatus Woesearchaeota archaeon]
MIKKLSDIRKEEIHLFGGKAVNLGFLIRNRFNVPEGICLSTKIKNIEEIRKQAIEALSKFGTVSVRSSATCEDSQKYSFAGQFDSFLNIDNEKDLIQSIIKCWNSVNSDRARAYANRNKIKDIKMAVIIQKMVDAELSGVVFTLDPMKKTDILIEITKGLGENIVSGSVTPSSFYLNKEFTIIKKNNLDDIDEDLIKSIAIVAKSIETKYNQPQDIEFSIKNNETFFLQSRPITTLG